MPWKPSKPHGDDDSKPIGRHIDVYQTNDEGKRERPHHEDMKIDFDERKPVVQDIIPPDGDDD